MSVLKRELMPLKSSSDVVLARQKVRQWAIELRFSLVDQTKLVTAASELARNALDHGKGGQMAIEHVANGAKAGFAWSLKIRVPAFPMWNKPSRTDSPPAPEWDWDLEAANASSTNSASNRKWVRGQGSQSCDGNSFQRMGGCDRRQLGWRGAPHRAHGSS